MAVRTPLGRIASRFPNRWNMWPTSASSSRRVSTDITSESDPSIRENQGSSGVSRLEASEPGSAEDRNRAAFEDLLEAVREPGRPEKFDQTEEDFQKLLEGTSGSRSRAPAWLRDRSPRASTSYLASPRASAPRKLKGTTSARRRGQGMTPHEGAVFNEVLEAIWRDLESSGVAPAKDRVSPYGPMLSERRSRDGQNVGVAAGIDSAEKAELAEEMDRLKEEMASLQTDVDLLDWAKRRVFTPLPTPEPNVDTAGTDATAATETAPPVDGGEPITYPPTYPHVLAHLIRVSRTTFQNPHLSLSLFHHAKTLSLDSYLQGCLSPAYNEILTTQWENFRDVEGVEQGIREMELHGVGWDRGTRDLIGRVVEQVSREALSGHHSWSDHTLGRLRTLEDLVEKDVKRQERRWAIMKEQEKRR